MQHEDEKQTATVCFLDVASEGSKGVRAQVKCHARSRVTLLWHSLPSLQKGCVVKRGRQKIPPSRVRLGAALQGNRIRASCPSNGSAVQVDHLHPVCPPLLLLLLLLPETFSPVGSCCNRGQGNPVDPWWW